MSHYVKGLPTHWSNRQASNSRPRGPKPRALPSELLLDSGGSLLWQLPHLPRCLSPVTDDTGYLYSLTRGVPTATPFHGCASTVAHLSRPIGVFVTFATAASSHNSFRQSTPHAMPGPVESNHPMSTRYSEKLFCAIYFN